nr:atp-dependent dna helicase ii subunit 2 [Quercus suber]
MANKEATVYIVDCGQTMGEISYGRSATNLEWALEYVWDKITSTVATGRKTAMVGVVGLRTDTTKNTLEADEDYQHITVLQDISQILMPQLRHLSHELKTSTTEAGDAISALVVAIQMISTTCKQLKYDRKIVLLTDARGNMNVDQLDGITSKLKEDKIELVILGVDFDDAEFGFKEESKDATKGENEQILKTLCTDLGDLGTCGTLAEAVDELQNPRIKSVKGTAVYKGFLTLGNPETFDTALAIDVERYVKVMIARPPTASRFVVRNDMAAGEATQSSATLSYGDESVKQEGHDGLTAVKSARTYTVQDDDAPGGRKELDLDELSKGYEYGRTAVHISESDRNVTTYETHAGFDIVGFVARSQVSLSLTLVIVIR